MCGRALDVDAVVPRLRQLAQEAHRLRREAALDLADEYEHVVPAVERRLVLGGARPSLSLS